MAIFYVRSTDGSDVDGGTTWALAKATLAGAFAICAAGDTIYVSQSHAETQASAMTLTSPGTAAAPVRVLCGNDAAEPPTSLAVTATVTTTGNGNSITFVGFAYSYGVCYQASNSNGPAGILFTSANPWCWILESDGSVVLRHVGTSTATISIGANSTAADDQLLKIINGSIRFNNIVGTLACRCPFEWLGGSVSSAGSAPTILITPSSNGARALLAGVDLSHCGNGQSLVDMSLGSTLSVIITNCKLGASVALGNGTITAGTGGTILDVINCDSAATNYRYHRQRYQGQITQETVILRTGGATDRTIPISWKMVTNANPEFFSPLESAPILLWNESLGSLTLEAEVITDNVTLTDAEAWIEVEYLGTSGFPMSVFSSDRMSNILSTPANQTTSTVSWTTTGLVTPIKQKLSTTFTPTMKGLIKVRIMLAKVSTTMYVCPKILNNSIRSMINLEGYMNEEKIDIPVNIFSRKVIR